MSDTAYPTITQCALVAAAFKILLFPAYKSTDFEVHRNWLAITNSLPVSEWYYEDTSQWTLDYPPFFAYFEWLMSHVARLADPAMLRVFNLEYDSWQTVYFQRTTVIVTELLLAYALQLFVESSPRPSRRAAHAVALSVLLSPGLLIIDHIHFQYNGFMYGILVLSLVLARGGKDSLLASGLVFAALLCFKHIYVYLAPAYFVFLLRAYCLSPKSIFDIQFGNCLRLGGGIVAIVAAAFGPFAALKQMPQMMSRLFPFARGLCHAYWAPNVWALYSFADRALIVLAPRLGLDIKAEALQSVTRGLVGDTSFAVLPEISARTCFALTLLFQVLPLIKLFMQPKPSWENFIGATTLCGYASFLFGYHVHEKAILLVIIPFSLIALRDRRHFSTFRPLAVAGHVSLFPLLFTPAEFPIKTVYTLLWLVIFLAAFDRLVPASNTPRFFPLDRFNTLYFALCIPLVLYTSLVHQLVFGQRLEFLPLMLTSVIKVSLNYSFCAMATSDPKFTTVAPTTRTVPMKVLCLGMSRTGTVSLRESLLTLGYRHSYHMVDAIASSPYRDCRLWIDLLNKKEAGKKVTREDLDQILGHCQAVTDMPAAYFAEELIEAYPDAKVILTTRDTESWFASMTTALRPMLDGPLAAFAATTDQLLLMPTRWIPALLQTLDRVLFQKDFAANGRHAYEAHNARVRSLVPASKLLEYHVREGWVPLCAFLGREVPEDGAAGGGTPHLNSSEEFAANYHGLNYRLLLGQGKRLLDMAAYTALVVVVAGAAARRWGFKWSDLV
ncbi:hypothetical protein LMH87_003309 [Akanthomyces muscarius]|uniref:Alpha-1,3-glucosyltransferase n=1 Tax=Akanthomyces muscarius TaxID=2231603 RepID=A0A9W8Q1I9_AKAMU|nr:hypothetical protein LMH87_003309 [Akanthomyces muscarius]KAJ4144425.1 hypothetical protein LMH87_003309 [Akanthomyces muscarius]